MYAESDIAIVGLAGRFPGARTPDELWQNVVAGVESIAPLSDEALLAAGVPPDLLRDPLYVKAGAPLADVAGFDAGFFGFSPRDAAILDPQHRHFLECAWEALEDAGHVPERFPGAIGVYGGCGMNAYFMFNLLSNPDLVSSVGLFLLRHTGNDKDFLTTRVSYLFGLTGPSVGVQTACSTSLVAVHAACQALLARECDLALAGGVTIELPHGQGYRFAEGEILSPDGHCRAFDAAARGTVFGSGAGVVALRRLAEALDDGDHVHAIIKGSAVNNDGRAKVGYLAPSVDGQAAAVREAIDVAGVTADRIGYVEAHGTGTPVGDPIEIAALTAAFRTTTARTGFCAIGSLKTNIGHLDTAAGVAGLIKATKALQHRTLPPSLHFTAPNPAIDFAATPFVVPTRSRPWPGGDGPRFAGVNSLGVGGTNAHVILQEPPVRAAATSAASAGCVVLPVSARTPAALDRAAARLADFLEAHPDVDLADVAFTLQRGRRTFDHRRVVAAATAADAVRRLRAANTRGAGARPAFAAPPRVIFMFPGGGAQYPAMGRDLFRDVPAFRDAVLACASQVTAAGGPDLVTTVFEAPDTPCAEAALARPLLSLLSVFTVEYALAALYRSWGLVPSAVIGHSLGEYVAAHLAGVMSLEDALAIVTARGHLFEQAPAGGMLSVALDASTLAARLPGGVSIAAHNAPAVTVVSGPVEVLAALERDLTADAVECQRVRIDVAAHSALLDPFLPGFEAFVARLPLRAPALPLVSNVSGQWAGDDVATASYWTRHLREPVRFADGLATALATGPAVCLEIGPGRALTSFARQCAPDVPVSGTMRHRHDVASDVAVALEGLATPWTMGAPLDWTRLPGGGAGRRTPLPPYPFEHERHWIAPGRQAAAPATTTAPALPRAADQDAWWWAPGWHPREVTPAIDTTPLRVVWIAGSAERGTSMIEALRARGHAVQVLIAGQDLDLRDAGACRRLLDAAAGPLPTTIVVDAFDPVQPFEPALRLVQGLGAADADSSPRVVVLTHELWSVDARPAPGDPAQALALGPLAVVSREYPALSTTAIDLAAVVSAATAARFVDELAAPQPERLVVLRDDGRWVHGYARTPAPAPARAPAVSGGTTLITGAFGGVGRLVARWAAGHHGGTLLLLGRRRPRTVDALVADLRSCGADARVLEADLADAEAVRRALATAGPVTRVYHLAGRIADAPLAAKSPRGCDAVLAPKVAGTRHLAAALAAAPPESFVLVSSTSAFLGLPGQADYAAANLFLAAFADSVEGRRVHARTLYWGAWHNRGMTGRLAAPEGVSAHPLLGHVAASFDDEWTFEADHTDAAWWYDEHRTVHGTAICPGTAFLELLHAAARTVAGRPDVQLTDVTFLRPLELPRGGRRRVTTRVTRAGDTWRLGVASMPDGTSSAIEHVEATATFDQSVRPAIEVAELRQRCDRRALDRQQALASQQVYMRFGPRWQALGTVHVGEFETVADIRVSPLVAADLADVVIHPALLDVAIAAALSLVPGHERGGLLVPFGAARAWVQQPLRGDGAVAYARMRHGTSALMARLDIVVADATGAPCYVVENLALRRVDGDTLTHLQHGTTQPGSPAAVLVLDGIRDAEGLMAMPHAFSDGAPRHLLVSPFAPDDLHAAVDRWWPRQVPHPRRELAARPASRVAGGDGLSSLEHGIAEIWGELLGVPEVGPDDDFFAMGGHSLLGVRLFSRIESRLGHRVDLSTLFTARTVRAIARHIADATAHQWKSLTPITSTGTRPPFYCVHGVGGGVLSFMDLAAALGADQPFFGLQAVGLDGASAPQTDIRAQAETYVTEILEAQPEGPYYIGGYSHGARVAYEMACQLERAGRTPAFLALIDTWASDALPRGPLWPLRLAANLPAWLWHDVHESSWAQNLDRLRRGALRLRRAVRPRRDTGKGVTVAEHLDVRALPDAVRTVFEANFEAFSGYEPGRYHGPVTVFRATAQPILTPHLPDHGWRRYAARVRVLPVTGNHLAIVRAPYVAGLAASLRGAMDEVIGSKPS